MAELKINADNIGLAVKTIRDSKENINTSTQNIKNPSNCSGIMISSYVGRIGKIGKLLDSYKQLLERDIVDIIVSEKKIIEMDQKIKTLYQK